MTFFLVILLFKPREWVLMTLKKGWLTTSGIVPFYQYCISDISRAMLRECRAQNADPFIIMSIWTLQKRGHWQVKRTGILRGLALRSLSTNDAELFKQWWCLSNLRVFAECLIVPRKVSLRHVTTIPAVHSLRKSTSLQSIFIEILS